MIYIICVDSKKMIKNLLQKFAGKFLDAALKLNGVQKISENKFKNMILEKDPKAIDALCSLLNISEEDVKTGISQYEKLLKQRQK